MSYQVLARKWRPHDFSSLLGQDHVVRALTHALTEIDFTMLTSLRVRAVSVKRRFPEFLPNV